MRVTDAASRTATQSLTLTVTASLDITHHDAAGRDRGCGLQPATRGRGRQHTVLLVARCRLTPAGADAERGGVVSGTPTGAGSTTFTVRVTDAASRTATQSLTLTVNASLGISTTALPEGTVGTSYSQQLSASGGVAPYTWTVSSGSLPDGLDTEQRGTR